MFAARFKVTMEEKAHLIAMHMAPKHYGCLHTHTERERGGREREGERERGRDLDKQARVRMHSKADAI